MYKNILSKSKTIFLVCLLAVTNFNIFANEQFIEIKGITTDTNSKIIPYIFVSVEGTNIKVFSDINGNFILRISDKTKFPIQLTFSSVNHISQTITISKSNYKELQSIKLIEKEGYLEYEKQRKEAEEKRKIEYEKRRIEQQNKLTERFIEERISDGDSVKTEVLESGELKIIAIKKKGEEEFKGIDSITLNKSRSVGRYLNGGIEEDFSEFATMDVVDRASSEGGRGEDLSGFSESIEWEMRTKSAATLAAKIAPESMTHHGLPPPNEPQAEAGLLTAGELNDFTKWKLWEDIKNTDLNNHTETWKIFPNERYVAQLTNPNGNAIVNAKVTLKDNQGNNIWQTYTDNTGKAELWNNVLNDSTTNTGKPYSIVFEYEKQTKTIPAEPFHIKINTAEMNVSCNEINAVDIDFIVDATGSMGDEIRYLQEELYDVIQKLQTNNPHIDLRTGSIFYRDFGDNYIIRKSEFDKDINKTIDFIKEQGAAGGGDYPEAVDIALYESIENRDWRENTLSKIIFLILDAPPHSLDSCIKQVQRQIRIAAMKGIRIVPLVCSGADKNTEYLMRAIALATNGTYVFLTDDSKIGDSHIKPTTDKYEVEKLNHILLRVISQFSTLPNCSNDWKDFDSTITSFDKFMPKPYKEIPEDNTERIEDISNLLKVYPMPCDGILNIEILQTIPHLYVSDITGKVLQNFEFDEIKNFAINLVGYSNGIYFVNAFYQGRWYCIKFLMSR